MRACNNKSVMIIYSRWISLTNGIAALVAAVAALLFAIVQTFAALAQYVSVSSRCSRRVTGVFDLTAGFWFHLSSLSWNPQYRMPVLTMPGLRGESVVTMERYPLQTGFRPGKNYDRGRNGYVDYGVLRVVSGTDDSKVHKEISILPTVLRSIFAMAWTPIGLALSSLTTIFCFPPAWVCSCACTGAGCCGSRRHQEDDDVKHRRNQKTSRDICLDMLKPLTFAWEWAIRYKSGTTVSNHGSSPGLEAAAWSQFLVNYQAAWWGYANIRWEWRLATMIPSDIYGATIETTMADVRLLAALAGMSCSSSPGVVARTKCGEMLTRSQHMTLGTVVYYRSGRENIAPKITRGVPVRSSRWLHCQLEVQAHLKKSRLLLSSSGEDKEHRIATLLSRPRTEYDAQLDLSLGNNLGFIFETETFRALSSGLHATDDSGWKTETIRIFLGPLGQGLAACSCLTCCTDWVLSHPAYDVKSTASDGHITTLFSYPWVYEYDTGPPPALSLQAELKTYRPVVSGFRPAHEILTSTHWSRKPGAKLIKESRIVGPVGCYTTVTNAAQGRAKIRGGLKSELEIQARRVCVDFTLYPGASPKRMCTADVCKCMGGPARIARPVRVTGTEKHSFEEAMAVAAINNDFLSRVDQAVLRRAAEEVAGWICQEDQQSQKLRREVTVCLGRAWEDVVGQGEVSEGSLELVKVVMAATEMMLRVVRRGIGMEDMWAGSEEGGQIWEDDFGGVVLGS
ncbi:hypothetical protein QC764_121470 [Podospora pseudoanserina]|uniref:Uncharacterized protein n=1 Tax=Podospora pseudoanserina TaxID=2609844 RepID=A0ABR0IRL0_9PEZI|nr:hypothetical protein QC764_121470 [Podospora pseudoanserina]